MPRAVGPGPKFLLPPTVGLVNHDPTFPRAPGYTFGSRYSYCLSEGPGPHYWVRGLSNRGRDNNTGFSLYGRPTKSIWETAATNSPGPVYAVSKDTTDKKSPAFTFGSPYKQNYRTEGPGPNSYPLQSDWGKNTRGARIGGRTSEIMSFSYDFARTPGPAYYNHPDVSSPRAPAFSMGRRLKEPPKKLITPAPNMYKPDLDLTNPRSPRFTMGIRHHEDVLNVANVSD